MSGTSGKAADMLQRASKRLLTGVNPTKRFPSREIPRDYFVENRKNVTVVRINDRIRGRASLVHFDSPSEEQERLIFLPPSSDKDYKRPVLVKKI